MPPIRNLILALGDQLTPTLTSLAAGNPAHDLVLMAEVHDEATYVPHHKKKIAFLFAAMRHFAGELRAAGWRVEYVRLDAPGNRGSFTEEVARAVAAHRPERIVVTEAGEWRVARMMAGWGGRFGVSVDILPDERFLCSHGAFAVWAEQAEPLRMEYFYREMRRRTGLLMEGGEPAGGRWNFDAENRKGIRGHDIDCGMTPSPFETRLSGAPQDEGFWVAFVWVTQQKALENGRYFRSDSQDEGF